MSHWAFFGIQSQSKRQNDVSREWRFWRESTSWSCRLLRAPIINGRRRRDSSGTILIRAGAGLVLLQYYMLAPSAPSRCIVRYSTHIAICPQIPVTNSSTARNEFSYVQVATMGVSCWIIMMWYIIGTYAITINLCWPLLSVYRACIAFSHYRAMARIFRNHADDFQSCFASNWILPLKVPVSELCVRFMSMFARLGGLNSRVFTTDRLL